MEELLGWEVLKRFGWFYRLSVLKPCKLDPNKFDLRTSDKAWLRRCTHFLAALVSGSLELQQTSSNESHKEKK